MYLIIIIQHSSTAVQQKHLPFCRVLMADHYVTADRSPGNLPTLKEQLRAYVATGVYLEDIAVVANSACGWVQKRVSSAAPGEQLAIVFDLDETLWSNWEHIDANDMNYQHEAWRIWCDDGKAPVIESVRAIYTAARQLGLSIFFITGRRERNRCGTEKNLSAVDCRECVQLVCLPDAYKGTMGAFKSATRAQIEIDGFCIIANIGDQVLQPISVSLTSIAVR